jgi:Putative phage tail protein
MLLSDPVPLRSSENLRYFQQGGYLPWWYGDLRNSPQSAIQLSDTEFLIADHAIMGDVGVQIDGQATQGFSAGLVARPGEPAYYAVQLAAPLPAGAQLTVTGRGMPHPRTGVLMDNSADILIDVMQRSGYEMPQSMRGALSRLRAECAAAGIVIAGRVTSRETLRATINSIVRSVGGAWSSRSAWLHPPARALQVPTSGVTVLPESVVTGVFAQREQAFNELEIKFDDQSYQASHRQAIVLRAKASMVSGVVRKTMFAPWVRSPQVAQAVGERILRRAAGAVFRAQIEAPEQFRGVEIGDVLPVESAQFPRGSVRHVVVIGQERNDQSLRVTAELIEPIANQKIVVISRTVASDVTQLPAVEVEVRDGTVRFTVYDESGKPAAKVRVSLNGSVSKMTDGQGLVVFPRPTTPGVYTLYVYRTGTVPVEIPVTIA